MPNDAPNLSSLNVLVVDDDPMMLNLVSRILVHLGAASVNVAGSGAEALKMIKADPYLANIILCDWNMPKINGLEMLTILRASGAKIPFIMMTVRGDMNSIVTARKNGVSAYIVKPITEKSLREKLSLFARPDDVEPLNLQTRTLPQTEEEPRKEKNETAFLTPARATAKPQSAPAPAVTKRPAQPAPCIEMPPTGKAASPVQQGVEPRVEQRPREDIPLVDPEPQEKPKPVAKPQTVAVEPKTRPKRTEDIPLVDETVAEKAKPKAVGKVTEEDLRRQKAEKEEERKKREQAYREALAKEQEEKAERARQKKEREEAWKAALEAERANRDQSPPEMDVESVVDDHLLWLSTNGAEGARALFDGKDLANADFAGKRLSNASFRGTDLSDANFAGADLHSADFRGAELQGANLTGTDLSIAKLRHVQARITDLRGANLRGADLAGANLQGAQMDEADMHDVNLLETNVSATDLSGVVNLQQKQLARIRFSPKTILPLGLRLPIKP